MMNPIIIVATLWKAAGSLKLSVALCFLTALDAALAYPLIKDSTAFAPLGDVDLINWLLTYGRFNLKSTAWFFVLLILLTLLSINTFVCSIQRVIFLFRRNKISLSFFLKLGPHITHFAVLIILTGYLGTYLFCASLPGRALTPGGPPLKVNRIKGQIKAEIFEPLYYEGDRLDFFQGRLLDPGIYLTFIDQNGSQCKQKIAYGQPAIFNGWHVYLSDFYPKDKSGGMGSKTVNITLRRDPAAFVYLTGLALFVIGLGLYTADFFYKKTSKKDG
ncbi:MAG: hypothetical protein LBV23_08970 [Deltaproteobacteria bacterium]|jgi:hypothetical protein|nr:hypothetical protein [Deltaproteobacteria bacterium]